MEPSCRWMLLVDGHDAGPPARSGAAQHGHAISRRFSDRRGDRARHVPRRRSRARRALRGLIVVMWRAGLRISETLALTESDLDADRGAILVRHGKGDKRREVGMDQWGWELLCPWLACRVQILVGPLSCVIDGRTRGRPLTTTSVRQQLRRTAAKAGVRRFAPHQLRHAHAVEMAREGVPLNVIRQRRVIDTVHARRAPMIPASAGLRPLR